MVFILRPPLCHTRTPRRGVLERLDEIVVLEDHLRLLVLLVDHERRGEAVRQRAARNPVVPVEDRVVYRVDLRRARELFPPARRAYAVLIRQRLDQQPLKQKRRILIVIRIAAPCW